MLTFFFEDFLVDLHVLECPKHDLKSLRKYKFVCVSVCVRDKNFVASITTQELMNLMKLYKLFSLR